MSDMDVVVIGGGAAGLMCAIEAGKRGRRVVVIEHNQRIGQKIAISGGGRCNFTNLTATWENYLSANPSFCKSALARYSPWDFVGLVEKHGIAYHEKKLGQQFCDVSSRLIIEMLLAECAAAGVEIQTGCRVEEATKPERFRVRTTLRTWECDSLVIATGGLSFPKLGASDFGYRLARQFGLTVTALRPGLVPLTLKARALAGYASLSGASLPVIARSREAAFEENLLFTHRGLSGPAALQISSYWKEGDPLQIDLLPDKSARELLAYGRRKNLDPVSLLAETWPRRFAELWCAEKAPAKRLPHFTADEEKTLTAALHGWTITPSGTEGYAKAEVTVGGIDTTELSSKTMEARKVPGLYGIGEVVDVTGWLGGYNFQWAWASGFAAGQAA